MKILFKWLRTLTSLKTTVQIRFVVNSANSCSRAEGAIISAFKQEDDGLRKYTYLPQSPYQKNRGETMNESIYFFFACLARLDATAGELALEAPTAPALRGRFPFAAFVGAVAVTDFLGGAVSTFAFLTLFFKPATPKTIDHVMHLLQRLV